MSTLAPVGQFSSMTGLSESELQRRAEEMVDVKTGKIHSLSALDKALVDAGAVSGGPNMEAYTAQGSATANPHAIDEPAQVYAHGAPVGGFAPEAATGPTMGGPAVVLDKASKAGVSKMKMSGMLSENDPQTAGGTPVAADSAAASSEVGALSNNIQFEQIKMQIQRMAQIETAMSNVISTMNEQAQTAIRNSKA